MDFQENKTPRFTLRKIKSRDLGKVCKILSKIGINKIAEEFGKDKIMKMMEGLSGEEKNENIATFLGIDIALNCANVVLANIDCCMNDILDYLSELSDLDKETIDNDPSLMIEMIFAYVKKDEFEDFYKVVLKLLDKSNT